jgi:hypothetical protein
MAVLDGTIKSVFGFTSPTAQLMTGDTVPQEQRVCFITAEFSGTYAQGENATITGVDDAIADHGHQGKTVTLIGAMPAGSGLEGTDEYGVLQTSLTVSGGDITCQLSDPTLIAEHDSSALGTSNRPVCVAVSYKVV